MTVKEQIKHLKTFPKNLEIWKSGPKEGTYVPFVVPAGKVAYLKPVRRTAGRYWEGGFDFDPTSKEVVVI